MGDYRELAGTVALLTAIAFASGCSAAFTPADHGVNDAGRPTDHGRPDHDLAARDDGPPVDVGLPDPAPASACWMVQQAGNALIVQASIAPDRCLWVRLHTDPDRQPIAGDVLSEGDFHLWSAYRDDLD